MSNIASRAFVLKRINSGDSLILDKVDHTYTCGRARENEIMCIGVNVSRKHCTFYRSETNLFVTDIMSSNGLYINGVLQKPYHLSKLSPNDVIGIGCSDVNTKDDTMFAYKFITVKRTQLRTKSGIKMGPNSLPSTNSNTDTFKRKRPLETSEKVVPTKVSKVDEGNSVNNDTPGNREAKDTEDNDIIYVSRKYNTLEESKNKSPAECIGSNNELTTDKRTKSGASLQLSSLRNATNDESVLNTNKMPVQIVDLKHLQPFVLLSKSDGITRTNTPDQKNKQVNKEPDVLHRSSTRCKELSGATTSLDKVERNKNTLADSTKYDDTKKTAESLNSNVEATKEPVRTELKSCHNAMTELSALETTFSKKKPLITQNNTLDVPSSDIKFVHVGECTIKYEEELQITDTEEEAIYNALNGDPIAAASPIKLKEVTQEAKTRFSEVDVVTLSGDEDDIFPCSQLFDPKVGIDASVAACNEIKSESNDVEDNRFSRYDDSDIILLTDSEDEDNTWLERLSRSQLLVKDEIKKEELIENVASIDPSDEAASKPQSTELRQDINTDRDEENEAEENIDKKGASRTPEPDVVNEPEESDSSEELFSFQSNRFGVTTSTPVCKENKMKPVTDNIIEQPVAPPKEKSLITKRIPEIEPPHMPTGRRRAGGSGASERAQKTSIPKLSTKLRKEREIQSKIAEHEYNKEQKNRKMLHKWANCLPITNKKGVPINKETKRLLADQRKEKLRKLAMEEKEVLENNQRRDRIVSKPKAKVTLKTRGDFLISGERPASTSVNELARKLNSQLSTKECVSSSATRRTVENKDSSKERTSDSTVALQKALTGLKVSYRIPKKKNNMNSTKLIEPLPNKTATPARHKAAKDKSTVGPLVSILKKPSSSSIHTQKKKKVSFCHVLKSVREYEVDTTHALKKITGKDAPIPSDKLFVKVSKNQLDSCPKLEEFLLRILLWNPTWLTEQHGFNSVPPVVPENELHCMLTRYRSFNDYYKIVSPLLLLEIWSGISKEFETIEQNFKRRTLMCSIVKHSIAESPIPSTNFSLSSLMIEVLVTQNEMHKQAHPNTGDLVFFEIVKNRGKKQTFHKVFAYVTNLCQTVLTPLTHYNKDLNNYVQNPYALFTYTMQTKLLEKNIPVNRVQRLRAVTYLRPSLRMVQALQYFPLSPLVNLILNPQVDMYRLSPVSQFETCSLVAKDNLNEKQLEAVLKVANCIVQRDAKLCLIRGPPGTGKSKVIVNIVNQILYGGNRYRGTGGSSLRILLCAPSNAAIDEIVLRLLAIRSTIKENRFKMVRIGRPEAMHPGVRDISLTELAKRDVKKLASCYASDTRPLDSVEEERKFLEAKINAFQCEINNSQNVDEVYRKHVKMKLADAVAKYELLQNRKPIDEINPREFAKYLRTAENRLLLRADIITCTLSSCYNNQMESLFGGNRERISVCLVDEATQSCEAETLIPLMLGVNTLVLVGDPNQLPATVLSQRAKKYGLDQSIFARVQNAFDGQANNPIIMLDTQYRMQYDISYWPNKFFYASQLKDAPSCCTKFPFHAYKILNVNANQNSDKFSNTDEAEFVANLILCMMIYANLESWESSISIGVITPYNNQKSMILGKIDSKMSTLSEAARRHMTVDVNTVDGFQGQERDIIIMSCVRSQGIGFLTDRQRLCVALTRAKQSLILCGNFNIFMKDEMWKALLSDARSRGVVSTINANASLNEIKSHVIKRTTENQRRQRI